MKNNVNTPPRQMKQGNNFQRNPTGNFTDKKSPHRHREKQTQSGLSYIKAAAKKVAKVFLFWHRKPSSRGPPHHDSKPKPGQLVGIPSSNYNSTGSSSKSQPKVKHSDSSVSSNSSGQVGSVAFSIEEIYKATDNFSPANKLGEGGFGAVYRGKLKDGSFVAIKRAKKEMHDNRLFAEFKNEVFTLSKIEHLNLVRLFGYLEYQDERIIVIEYVSNGTLREHLDGARETELEIAERLDIAIDVAHAVTYLHMYNDLPIIHRDIKSSNILITEKLRAKVADFGFARLAAQDTGATHISTQVKGTAGYLDPEYVKTYQLTEKSDVYSFGVLLVELITGRYPLEPKRPLKERITARWAMERLKGGDAVVVMDPKLRRNPASIMVVEKVLKLARHCLAPQRKSRPSMKQCAEVLWGIRKDFKEVVSQAAASAAAHSETIDLRRVNRNMFGIEDSENYRFRSA